MDVSLIPRCEVFDAATTIHTTPRDMARYLALVWRDDAGAWEACEHLRALMASKSGTGGASTSSPIPEAAALAVHSLRAAG